MVFNSLKGCECVENLNALLAISKNLNSFGFINNMLMYILVIDLLSSWENFSYKPEYLIKRII